MKTFHWFLTASAPLIIFTVSCTSGSLSAKAALQSILTASCEYWIAPSPAGDDANPGRQLDERTIGLVRLDDHPFPLSDPGVRIPALDDTAGDDGRIEISAL